MDAPAAGDEPATREAVLRYALAAWQTEPEYLWAKFPRYAVLRHADSKKWYALVMDVPRNRLHLPGRPGTEPIDLLNVKLGDPLLRDQLIRQRGFLPAYHIRARDWVSVLLDGSLPFSSVLPLLQKSYQVTARCVRS